MRGRSHARKGQREIFPECLISRACFTVVLAECLPRRLQGINLHDKLLHSYFFLNKSLCLIWSLQSNAQIQIASYSRDYQGKRFSQESRLHVVLLSQHIPVSYRQVSMSSRVEVFLCWMCQISCFFFPLNFVLTMKSWTQNRSLNMALILGLGKRPQPQSNTLILARFNFIFSDHDFIQEQENRLLLMCKRTMALPVGRCGKFLLVVFCLICDLRWVICEKSGDVMFSALEFGGIAVGSLCSHEICFLLKRDVYNGHLSTSIDRNYSNSTTGFDRTGPA